MTSPQVLTYVDGCAGRIRLNRPEALNALSHAMCLAIEEALDLWRTDPSVHIVLLEGEGERAFCAGGDVAAIWRAAREGRPEVGRQFWRDEYRLNLKLAEYPKPVVSFMQGITMGGGLGLGCHLRHRVVCETSRFALPEARIGMVPDTGATLLLRRAPGHLGAYLGATGIQIAGEDAIYGGFADHYIARAKWEGLIRNLCATGNTWLVNSMGTYGPRSALLALQPDIDRAFASGDLDVILDRLDASALDWAQKTALAIRGNSAVSVRATLALLGRLTSRSSLVEALTAEFRYTFRAPQPTPTEFMEGVRAQLIDKDRRPLWDGTDVAARAAQALADFGGEALILHAQPQES